MMYTGRTGDLEWRLLCTLDGKHIVLGNGSYGRVNNLIVNIFLLVIMLTPAIC